MQNAVKIVLPVVLFTVLWFKWSVKEQCAEKILLTIWENNSYIKAIIPG